MSVRNYVVGTYPECPHCHAEEVDVIAEDAGIGSYEFWGARGHDSRSVYLCAECESEIEEFDPDRHGYGPPERDDHEDREERRLEKEGRWSA